LIILLSEGQMSDYRGAAFILKALPHAKVSLADKGYDADWFRDALADRKITACIPSRANRKVPIPHGREMALSGNCIKRQVPRLTVTLEAASGGWPSVALPIDLVRNTRCNSSRAFPKRLHRPSP
jgi:hypothetical protein